MNSKAAVYCSYCQEWHFVSDVKTLNIEEDIQGRDTITFECSEWPGREQKSIVVLKPCY